MPNGQPNIPQAGQRSIRANMKVISFVSPENPSLPQLKKLDEEVNTFLKTIDNQNRFLNGRNAYAVGNKVYVLIWYLEKIPEKPITKPFGEKAKQAEPVVKKDDKGVKAEEKKT